MKAPKGAKPLGRGNVYVRKDGKIWLDTDSIRRPGSTSRTAGDEVLSDDDDDDFDGDIENLGDVDNLGDDDDDDEMGRRRRRKGPPPGPKRRKWLKAQRAKKKAKRNAPGAKRKRMLSKYNLPAPLSARSTSPVNNLAANASGATVTITMTPTVTVKLGSLRAQTYGETIAVAAGTPWLSFMITRVEVGDGAIWNDAVGVDASKLGPDATVFAQLKDRMASPSQPLIVQGYWRNNGSGAQTIQATVELTAFVFKRPVAC